MLSIDLEEEDLDARFETRVRFGLLVDTAINGEETRCCHVDDDGGDVKACACDWRRDSMLMAKAS